METPNLNNLPLNSNPAKIMHVDLNSCFATAKQQAFKHLRGRPVLVSAYNSSKGCVIAPSIEAKKYGIKVGARVFEAKLLAPNAVVCTPDTALIRDVHVKFKKICADYSPNVFPKSIDEVVIDFQGMEYFLKNRSLLDIGREIKERLKKEVGEWMRCSVGIGPNRFIAKVASSYHKPDGLTLIWLLNPLIFFDVAFLASQTLFFRFLPKKDTYFKILPGINNLRPLIKNEIIDLSAYFF